jgi:predicted XRE-type DNA-binding protein
MGWTDGQALNQRPLKKEPKMARAGQFTFDDAIQVWLMRWSGMYQHDIAARLGVNQGRVSEVLTGKRYPDSESAARHVA